MTRVSDEILDSLEQAAAFGDFGSQSGAEICSVVDELRALRTRNTRLVSALNGCLSNENEWWVKAQAAVDEADE